MSILNRAQLERDYESILIRSGLVKDGPSFKIENFAGTIITQSSSGSRNQPLLIPRSSNDISDILRRFLNKYQDHFNGLPRKVAMLGGISHMNVTSSIQIDEVSFRFFGVDDLPEVITWQPEVITCYPSILRTLIVKFGSGLGFLKAIKVGGEKLFPADCENIFNLLPDLLIIEQYGSTELPALAFRSIHKSNFRANGFHIEVPFELQKQRFCYLNEFNEGWHPFVAKDDFQDLLFKMGSYYDTGDEAFWANSVPIDFRRKSDLENDYWPIFNILLRNGFISLQLDVKNRIIYCENSNISYPTYKINDVDFSVVRKDSLVRRKSSNKLPLIVDQDFQAV